MAEPIVGALKWDEAGSKEYETGTDKGVLYRQAADGTYPQGVAWNGLTALTESPSGGEATKLYADNIKYIELRSAEDFGGTIGAYMYPPEFAACNGEEEVVAGLTIGQQDRAPFGFSYRTIKGNDTEKEAHGYKIHCVYGCTISPSERAYNTVNDSPEAVTFSWPFSSVPTPVTGYKPTSVVVIDSTKVTAEQLKKIEDALYGTESTAPHLPSPDELIELMNAA